LGPERIVSPVSDVHTQAFDGQLVADVMLSRPKTLPADATVQQVRALLDHASVQMVLLTDGATFGGAITEIPDDVPADAAAAVYADPDPESIAPSESAERAFELAARHPHGRLVVLDERRNLVGLVCLDGTRTRFCGRASS
jgi:CBS domain